MGIEKIEELVKEQKIQMLLNIIDNHFAEIMGDWTDPRWNCREGYEAVAHLKELIFGDVAGYRHEENRSLDKFLADSQTL